MSTSEIGRPLPSGVEIRHLLTGHKHLITQLAWSPQGRLLASASKDGTLRIWDTLDGRLRWTLQDHSRSQQRLLQRPEGTFFVAWSPDGGTVAMGSADASIQLWDPLTAEPRQALRGHSGLVRTIAWSPDGRLVASGSEDRVVLVWDAKTGELILPSPLLHRDKVTCVAWSTDGQRLTSASDDRSVRQWDSRSWNFKWEFTDHDGYALCLACHPTGQFVASGSADRTIRILDAESGRQIRILEGHVGSVRSLSFSADGLLLASKSLDGTVVLWRCDTWQRVASLEEPTTYDNWHVRIDFHPRLPTLATLGNQDTVIRIWDLDLDTLLGVTSAKPTTQYTNAKVALVGDTSVGKTCLGRALIGEGFQPQESTHGRRVWVLERHQVNLADLRNETREILLWDLAGQPGYRLVHQLHLSEVVVALVVFDARSETDPFAGARYWERALRQAELLRGVSAPLKKLLVSARVDRSGVSASPARIAALVHELGFDGYFETSAKDGLGIADLARAIRAVVPWDSLPRVSSTELFLQIKEFLVAEKGAGQLLPNIDALYEAFLKGTPARTRPLDLRAQFDTCIALEEARDLIRRLSFGGLVLLQPELLDAYASALVNAARDEPDGLGCIAEEDARTGRFPMSPEERIKDAAQETLLLIATIEDLLRHEVALRQSADDGPYLVFPSQFTREHPDLPDPPGKAVIFRFDGPVLSIYSTLAVRLSHSGVFKLREMWKNAVTFTVPAGGICGMALREVEEGRGDLVLFFDVQASEETRFQFEEYVRTHLQRRAIPASITRRRVFVCSECGTPVTDLAASRRRERGFDWIRCGVCETPISLLDREERLARVPSTSVAEIDKAADTGRDSAAAAMVLQGKKRTKDYDIFISYSHQNARWVLDWLLPRLEQRGIYPYVDVHDFEVGVPLVDNIERALERTHKTLLVLTPAYLQSEWAGFESVLSQTQDPAALRRRTLPLMLEKCVLPKRLSMLVYANFTDEAKQEAELERLLAAVTHAVESE